MLSFNYGFGNKERSKESIKYGVIDTLIVSLVITILFEIIARSLAKLFALSNTSSLELIDVCEKAIRIASLGYIFMGFSVASQGVFQALRYSLKPLFTALLRLVIFVFPIAYFIYFILKCYGNSMVDFSNCRIINCSYINNFIKRSYQKTH